MRAIETTNFQTAPCLLARYDESRGWLERHIKNRFSPQPVKCSTGSDGRTARRTADTNFPRPIRFSPSKPAPRFGQLAFIAWNAERAHINGCAS
jgi:hypothetical protein